jgi:hypothetical protein
MADRPAQRGSGRRPHLSVPNPPAHVASLLSAVMSPDAAQSFDAPTWDLLIRTARRTQLLGTLAARIASARSVSPPERARRLLEAAAIESRFRQAKVRHLLATIAPVISRSASTALLLKGAAYVMQSRAVAAGRLPADVDVLVPRADLQEVESALLDAGWQYDAIDPYDDRYYRRWSHELPPMRAAGQALELDLHHAILPPYGRVRPSIAQLLDASEPITGQPFRALCATDQILHVAAHLFQDGDCANRLRDLVDFDFLFAEAARVGGADFFADALTQRARNLGLTRALAYTASFAAEWAGSEGGALVAERLASSYGGWTTVAVIGLAARGIAPVHPDAEPEGVGARLPLLLLSARSLWLRMPPHRGVQHALAKLLRRLAPSHGRVADADFARPSAGEEKALMHTKNLA